mmetsp:Transcript_15619/g.44225  ORF Transcript_15619/g.44225 Transcript_15619/m.44225 type:complete len:233 (-) Transcript_15619:131-829(-)
MSRAPTQRHACTFAPFLHIRRTVQLALVHRPCSLVVQGLITLRRLSLTCRSGLAIGAALCLQPSTEYFSGCSRVGHAERRHCYVVTECMRSAGACRRRGASARRPLVARLKVYPCGFGAQERLGETGTGTASHHRSPGSSASTSRRSGSACVSRLLACLTKLKAEYTHASDLNENKAAESFSSPPRGIWLARARSSSAGANWSTANSNSTCKLALLIRTGSGRSYNSRQQTR